MVPWPAANTPTRPVQGQFAVASSVKAAAGIAEFVVGVKCEQRQLIQYLCVYLTALDDEQGSSFRVAGIGWIVMNIRLNRNKSRDMPRMPNRAGSGIRRSASSNHDQGFPADGQGRVSSPSAPSALGLPPADKTRFGTKPARRRSLCEAAMSRPARRSPGWDNRGSSDRPGRGRAM